MNIHLPSFSSARVLIAGDIMLDRYWDGDAARISPEAPVPVVRVDQVRERPGGAANVALNLAAIGARATVIGVTGEDEAADALGLALAGADVDSELLRLRDVSTITKLRVISRHQQLIRLDFESDLQGHDLSAMEHAFEQRLESSGLVVLSDYGKGTLRQIPRLIELGRRAGKPVFVDPKGADFSIYRGATLLKPNRAEFEAIAGPCDTEADLLERGERLRSTLALDALLITRGVEGMTLFQRDSEPQHFTARAREVFDVTGAGDTVIAVLAAAFASGCTLAEATALANLSAGIVVRKLGTASVTVPELRRVLFEVEELGRGVVEPEVLETLVVGARARGERVVMTNGCFDIVHAGHVAFLECARKLGDRLVVAVNDDASVRRLKGARRPVHSLEQRMEVLSGLGAVDWVVPFSEDTPEALICGLCPDFLVKGGDYTPDGIAGAACVRAAGGEVRVLPYIEGYSTTGTIDRIRESNRE